MSRPPSRRDVVLVTGPAGALSGGDVHALRLVEAWSARGSGPVAVLGPAELRPFLPPGDAVTHVVLRSPFERSMRSHPLSLTAGLAWRGLAAIPHCRGATAAVASSHLVFDVFPAAVAHLLWRTPVVSFVYHLIADSGRPSGPRSRVAIWLERVSLLLLRRCRATVFVDNDQTRDALEALGFPRGDLHPTTNAYDPGGPIPDHRPGSPPRLAFVGRLVEPKGVWTVVDLARRLAASGSEARIDVVGDGPLRRAVTEQIERHGLENIELHGFVEEARKWEILSRASLFLAPSTEEGWGIAVGEALLAGVPVVARALPAYDHFGDRILKTPVSPDEEFVRVVLELVDDDARLAAMTGATARGRSSLPRWTAVLESDLEVIDRVTRAHP